MNNEQARSSRLERLVERYDPPPLMYLYETHEESLSSRALARANLEQTNKS